MLPHRMGGVGAEVYEDLLHLGGISEDETRLVLDLDPYVDGRWGRCPKEVHGLLDKAAQLQRHLLLLALSAVSEQLFNDLPAPEPCLHNPSEEVLLVVPLDRTALCQFGKPYDGRKDVVEVMGDAAGERAEGLHLVRLAKLLLDAPGLRDIEVDLEDCQGIPVGIPLDGLAAQYDDLVPGFRYLDKFSLPTAFFGQHGHILMEGHGEAGFKKGVNGIAHGLRLGPAVHLFCAVIPEDDPAPQVADENSAVGELEQVGLPLQRFLRRFSLGDVGEDRADGRITV